jgi:hypothetical protein
MDLEIALALLAKLEEFRGSGGTANSATDLEVILETRFARFRIVEQACGGRESDKNPARHWDSSLEKGVSVYPHQSGEQASRSALLDALELLSRYWILSSDEQRPEPSDVRQHLARAFAQAHGAGDMETMADSLHYLARAEETFFLDVPNELTTLGFESVLAAYLVARQFAKASGARFHLPAQRARMARLYLLRAHLQRYPDGAIRHEVDLNIGARLLERATLGALPGHRTDIALAKEAFDRATQAMATAQ